MNIYVGSLPFDLDEEELKEIFEEYGEVSTVKVITDKFTGKSRGFGFVEMPDVETAKKAIEDLNGAEIDGRTIVVNESVEKPEGSRRSNFRGGDNRGGGGGYNKGGNFRGGGNKKPGGNFRGGGDNRKSDRTKEY
jgi:RNA recognition motif-containing protein